MIALHVDSTQGLRLHSHATQRLHTPVRIARAKVEKMCEPGPVTTTTNVHDPQRTHSRVKCNKGPRGLSATRWGRECTECAHPFAKVDTSKEAGGCIFLLEGRTTNTSWRLENARGAHWPR